MRRPSTTFDSLSVQIESVIALWLISSWGALPVLFPQASVVLGSMGILHHSTRLRFCLSGLPSWLVFPWRSAENPLLPVHFRTTVAKMNDCLGVRISTA